MKAKDKSAKNKKRHLVLAISVAVLLFVGVVAGLVLVDRGDSAFFGLNLDHLNKSKFVFDTEAFPDWVTTGNVWNDDESDGPAVSWLTQQCEKGSQCQSLVDQCRESAQCEELDQLVSGGHCMVNLYYMKQQINVEKAVDQRFQEASKLGVKPQSVETKNLEMKTSEGVKTYQLHKYDSGNKSYKQGVAFGYIGFREGHIDVRGTCDQADQLEDILPVLKVVSFER